MRQYPLCKSCGKMLSDYRSRTGLCKKCWQESIKPEHRCIDCGILIDKLGRSQRCHACANKGENNPNFQGGIDGLGYPMGFNETLKTRIKTRDGYRCQLCGMTHDEHIAKFRTSLHVHHIDYNKLNLSEDNLTTLCLVCNSKVNFNKAKWVRFFSNLIGV